MNKEHRVLPQPDKYAVCAIDEVSIKEYYRGYFDEIFVFLHPFIKPISLDISMFTPTTYPDKLQLINQCKSVSWSEFLELSSIASFDELDIGLRTRILGLKQHLCNNEIANLIDIACNKYNLVEPTEGMLPQIIIDRILKAIQSLGFDWLWIGDEFCTERKLEYIEDLICTDSLYRHNLFTPDKSILITTHWDSHFSFICAKKDIVDKIVEFANLEGFYCEEDTEIYWSIPKKN